MLKLKLVQFYIEGTETPGMGLATLKEIQDWAQTSLGVDRNKIKQMNQQLINEGLVREKKKPTPYFQMTVGQSGELQARVDFFIEQVKNAENAKKKKLLQREEVYRKECCI